MQMPGPVCRTCTGQHRQQSIIRIRNHDKPRYSSSIRMSRLDPGLILRHIHVLQYTCTVVFASVMTSPMCQSLRAEGIRIRVAALA